MPEGKSNLVDIDATVYMETEKAILIDHRGEERTWLPKSQVEVDTEGKKVTMPEWLALEKGLI